MAWWRAGDMEPKICLILFGIIAITNGIPSKDLSSYSIRNEHELQQLLKTLYRDGKVDLALSHHEDSPNKHHVDTAYLTRHDERSHSHHIPSAETHVSYPRKERSNLYHNDAGDHRSLNKLENLVSKNKGNARPYINNNNDPYILLGLDKLKTLSDKKTDADGILDFLKNLDENVDLISSRQYKAQSSKNRDLSKQRSTNYEDADVNYEEFNRNDNDDDEDNYNNFIQERIYINNGDDRNTNDDNMDDRNDNEWQRYDNYDRNADIDKAIQKQRSDDRDDDDNNRNSGNEHIQQQLSRAKTYKINDELDAIVLDMSDLNKYFTKSSSSNRGDDKQTQVKYMEDVELNELVSRDNLGSDSKPVEAIVVDLTNTQNDLTKGIRNLVKNVDKSSKRDKLYKSYSSIKDSNYDTRILAHNEENNNVYVPKWLLDEVVSKAAQTNLRNIREQYLRSVLPLTAKQKQKLIKTVQDKKIRKIKRSRRSIDEDVGVPFHLDIQGLGQVNV